MEANVIKKKSQSCLLNQIGIGIRVKKNPQKITETF